MQSRPRFLLEITLAMAVLTPFDYLLIDWDDHATLVSSVATTSFLNLLGFLVLWFFWNGRNWARWLVLSGVPFAVWDLIRLWPSAEPIVRIYVLTGATVYLFSLFWLNTPAVRSYFTQSKRATQL